MEANFADLDFAECTYRSVVRRIVSFGVSPIIHHNSSPCIQRVLRTDNNLLLLWFCSSRCHEVFG
jgi:hypothetical protein